MPPASSQTVTPAHIDKDADPEEHERLHVHDVYEQIAPHFSSTRYKPWPVVAEFLASLPPGSVGLDAGTGNGKYLSLPHDCPSRIWTIGLDRSRRLLEIARNAGGCNPREVVWGDTLGTGWRSGIFDYAISIATIHHLATPARRCMAVRTLLQSISPSGGRLLIYVWAIEQDHLSKRVLPSTTETVQSEGTARGQDVFVPWVLPSWGSRTDDAKVLNRYYHMFASGELEELVREAAAMLGLQVAPASADPTGWRGGIEIVHSGWERSNWYIEIKRWESRSKNW